MAKSKRIALVSGASRGIGRAVAIRLARDFDGVAIVARSADSLADTARALEAHGAQAFAIPLDLKHPDAATRAVELTIERFGGLDALATVAGAVSQADLFELTDDDWADALALKFHSMRKLSLAAWPYLRARAGAIVITSGTSAITPKASLAAVGSINALISALAKAFADRGQQEGVRVNSVSPGPVMTDRRRSMLERYAATRGLTFEEALDHFLREAGLRRYGTPEDIAEAYAWLLSPAASWVNGSSFRIDGGEIKTV